jgi:hypothetical protein
VHSSDSEEEEEDEDEEEDEEVEEQSIFHFGVRVDDKDNEVPPSRY